jgi:lambda family phage portal protein
MGILSSITGLFHGKTIQKANTQRRRFDAAAINRFTADWITEQSSIDNELKSDIDRLRARSRDLANNNDYVKKWLKMCVNNIVGPQGFVLQARVEDTPGQQDKWANDAIEAAWYKWSRVCETSGRMGFVDLTRAIVKALARDGEFILRKSVGKTANNPYGLGLQLIDIDRLDTQHNVAPNSAQNRISMGIELDAFDRPVAYHLFKSHPNGNGNRIRERIPADQIIHRYLLERPEQTRGIPWAHAVIKSLHDLQEYNKSAMIAARKGADTLGFFVSPNGEPPMMDAEENGEPIAVSVPGQYDTLPEGYDFRAYDSTYPSATYGEFVKAHLRRIATGLGVSYNTLAEDLEGVNYSSIRSGVINERDEWMTLQSWMIESFLTPLYEEWLRLALLNGAISLPNGSALPLAKYEKFASHYWQARRWSWVDPLKDIEASLAAIRAGLSSPYAIAGQMGLDLDDVIADLSRANAAAAAAGLPAYAAINAPEPAKPAEPASQDDGTKAMLAIARSMANQKPGETHIHNHPAPVTVNQGEIRVINEPPINHFSPEIHEREQVVNVPAPIVNVNVAAPEVTANFEAIMPAVSEIAITSMPTRETTSEVIRDANNNIKTTKQTEADA